MSPRRRSSLKGTPALVAAVLVVLLVGALILLTNPRHRVFYFGSGRSGTVDAAASAAKVVERVKRLAPGAVALLEPGGVESRARPHAPRPDTRGRIRIPVADERPGRLPFEGVPPGWELHEFAGRADVEVVRADGRLATRLTSDRTSFVLYRDAFVDLTEFPLLTWSWKVIRLPPRGDVRSAATDDQAAQLYVVFPRWPSPRTASDVIGYVWDSRAPVGTRVRSPKADNVRVIVVESGPARLHTWRRHERNVAADYLELFGRRPPRVGMVAVMIDSDDTGGRAEALMGDLAFSRSSPGTTEIPSLRANMSRMTSTDRLSGSTSR